MKMKLAEDCFHRFGWGWLLEVEAEGGMGVTA